MKSEAYTIWEEKTRLLDQVKMIQKDNIDITGEISNKVVNHARADEEIITLNNIASENIKSIEETRNKNDKSMTEKADQESKLDVFIG